MSLRAMAVCIVACLACARGHEDSQVERGSTARGPSGSIGETQPPADPGSPTPLCPPVGGTCIQGFALALEESEPWPLGRYFLRVSLDRRPATVCEIAFEPVVGAVTDTCNSPAGEFQVVYRYDEEIRAIKRMSFGLVSHVDMEILVAENLPPVVEVHHDVVVQKCSSACELAAPLSVRVQLGSAVEPPSVDGGKDDASAGVLDAAADAAL